MNYEFKKGYTQFLIDFANICFFYGFKIAILVTKAVF